MTTPVVGDFIEGLLKHTAGKVVGRVLNKFLPPTMTEAEKVAATQEAQRLILQEIEAERATIDSVNQTIRAEAQSDNWWTSGWRPYWGFISGTAFLFVCILVCILAYKAVLGGKPEAMVMIPQIIGAFAALFAIPGAILGVTAWHRGKKQRIEAGEK